MENAVMQGRKCGIGHIVLDKVVCDLDKWGVFANTKPYCQYC